jgi:hypothetical protein
VLLQASLDIAVERAQALAQNVMIFASIAHLQLVGLAVMGANRRLGRLEQGARQFFADTPSDRYRSQRSGSWIAL